MRDKPEKALRKQLSNLLAWRDAHADWKQSLRGLSTKDQGIRPAGSPHSAWELLEHARLAQRDILDFCKNPRHVSPKWPEGYWPKSPAPPNASAWARSAKAFEADTRALQRLAANPKIDLLARIPHGSGQTILREILLAADHNSYHLGQLVLTRKLLRAWPKS